MFRIIAPKRDGGCVENVVVVNMCPCMQWECVQYHGLNLDRGVLAACVGPDVSFSLIEEARKMESQGNPPQINGNLSHKKRHRKQAQDGRS